MSEVKKRFVKIKLPRVSDSSRCSSSTGIALKKNLRPSIINVCSREFRKNQCNTERFSIKQSEDILKRQKTLLKTNNYAMSNYIISFNKMTNIPSHKNKRQRKTNVINRYYQRRTVPKHIVYRT